MTRYNLSAYPDNDLGEVLAATTCPAGGKPLAWNVGSGQPPDGTQVAHFLVPAPRMRDDVVHTCRNQRLFCSEDCVAAWLAATGSARGYVMDLGPLWRLAAHWYDGRLELALLSGAHLGTLTVT